MAESSQNIAVSLMVLLMLMLKTEWLFVGWQRRDVRLLSRVRAARSFSRGVEVKGQIWPVLPGGKCSITVPDT